MNGPKTMNNPNGVLLEVHTLDIPPCCPVSKNPRSGSTITILYCPGPRKLEVASLYAYLHAYRGGLKDDEGAFIVRDMEGMISRIAQDCANVLCVPVNVVAQLVLLPKQEMLLVHRAMPESEAV